MEDKIKVLIDKDEVYKKIAGLAEVINRDYADKTVHLVGILKGGVFFMCELAKHLTMPVTIDFIQVSSYGNAMTHGDRLIIKKDLDEDIENRHVLIVEDIIDTGNTLKELVYMLKERKPASLEICVLLDKKARRETEVAVKYSCFDIPDEFVVGYGLDYAEKHRNYPYIGAIIQED